MIGSVNLRNGKRSVRSTQISKQSLYLGQHHPLVSRLGLFFIFFSSIESTQLLSITDVCASCSNNVIKRKIVHQQRCRSFFCCCCCCDVFSDAGVDRGTVTDDRGCRKPSTTQSPVVTSQQLTLVVPLCAPQTHRLRAFKVDCSSEGQAHFTCACPAMTNAFV